MKRSQQHTICDDSGKCLGYVEPNSDGHHFVVLDNAFYFVAEARSQREAERILRDQHYRRHRH